MSVIDGQNVLVVDGQPETVTVLKTIFEPCGVSIGHIRSDDAAMVQSDCAQPGVLVLHEVNEQSPLDRWGNTPRVIIGKLSTETSKSDNRQQHLESPFHYGELVRAINHMLSR